MFWASQGLCFFSYGVCSVTEIARKDEPGLIKPKHWGNASLWFSSQKPRLCVSRVNGKSSTCCCCCCCCFCNWISVAATARPRPPPLLPPLPPYAVFWQTKADLMTFPTDLMRENPSYQLHLSFLMVLDDEKSCFRLWKEMGRKDLGELFSRKTFSWVMVGNICCLIL